MIVRRNCSDADRSAIGGGVARIDQKIGKDLLKLSAISEDQRGLVIVGANDRYLISAKLGLEQLQGVIKDPTDIYFREFSGAAGSRKVQQVVDDVGGALGLTT